MTKQNQKVEQEQETVNPEVTPDTAPEIPEFLEITALPVVGRAALKVAQAAQATAIDTDTPDTVLEKVSSFLNRVSSWINRARVRIGQPGANGEKVRAIPFCGLDGKAFLFESKEEASGLMRTARPSLQKLDTFKLEVHQLPGTGTPDAPARFYVSANAKLKQGGTRSKADLGFMSRWNYKIPSTASGS